MSEQARERIGNRVIRAEGGVRALNRVKTGSEHWGDSRLMPASGVRAVRIPVVPDQVTVLQNRLDRERETSNYCMPLMGAEHKPGCRNSERNKDLTGE